MLRIFARPRSYAKRAQGKFARGSRGWLIAEDIITYKIPA